MIKVSREMKIQSNGYTYRIESKGNHRNTTLGVQSREKGWDQVEISASSQLLKECVAKAKHLNQDRQALVQELKQQLQTGSYVVSPDKIAGAMIEDGFFLN